MVLKAVKEVCNFSGKGDTFICDFNGKRLIDLEETLRIAQSKFRKIKHIDFFEFGSQEWNPSHEGPRSGMGAHFMGLGTDLLYGCFDAYSEPIDFDANVKLIEGYEKAEKDYTRYCGWMVEYKDPIFWEAKKNFESLSADKDLSDSFISIRNEKYFKKFYQHYKGVDLNKLKKDIQNFSINDYARINEEIQQSENPLVYSINVLNAPNLTDKCAFWNIENAFHIHSGSTRELSEFLNFDLGLKFFHTNGSIFEKKDEFIDTFAQRFDVMNYDVNMHTVDGIYFISWDASKSKP